MKTVTTRKFHLPLASPRTPAIAIIAVFLAALGALALQAQQRRGEKPYALIFGTVWGPDNHPVYGVTVKIRRVTDKPRKTRWQVFSDHHGEFAQRVPPGEADYILTANTKGVKGPDGRPLHLVQEVRVHVYNEEREDTGLHLTY